MSFLVVLPVIDRELSERCVVRLEVEADALLVVDNSAEGFADGWDATVVRPDRNLGVARSWNLGARRVLEEGIDYLVVLSAATEFAPGGFATFAGLLDEHIDERGLQTHEGWHCLALGRPLLEACGLFDENFWPAYFEDLDYLRRMELSGLWHPGLNPLPQTVLDTNRWGNAHGMLRAGVHVNFRALLDYYGHKWGGPPHEERFGAPFGRGDLREWPAASVEDLAARYGLIAEPLVPA